MAAANERNERLKVIVVGAGLGGCAAALAMHHAGFEVVVYEKIKRFLRLGDSLGLGENALRLLQRWGLHDQLIKIGNKSENMQIRRWQDGKILAVQPLMDMAGYIGHRGDYHDAFLQRVRECGIPIHMGHKVVQFDENKPSIILEDGREIEADVIIGADGIKSLARELVLGFHDAPKSSGYACFRAYFKGEPLKSVPECQSLIQKDCVNIWIGEDKHLVQNTLRDGEEFNWIITHKDTADIKESWFQPGDMDEVRRLVADLDRTIASAVEVTESCLDWKICYRDPLPTWVSRSHKIALLGDSCHAHLPTSAQGASQATESAAVLAVCLKLAGKDNIPLATRVYEKLRFDRVRQSQLNGEDVRDRWHNILKKVNADQEIDPDDVKIKNRWLYPYDAEADTYARWDEMSKIVREELASGNIRPLFDPKTGPVRNLVEYDAFGRPKSSQRNIAIDPPAPQVVVNS
ncbi:monooxygenase [Gloeophyllum trabeum ATCC 11539]|uniref:Monooxygenase n=1 Tax=Gloeophyllum trabeum (strain ATCC 11539 / FP-39264 / Madison 617) TaxID=670483 RepID=S7RS54_GLOTA|nr:monooxygenase [Gloeophyllum trabeum ATCC 11539]EPQ57455.1 monooxygenase [Gloeophyllum trabeum ATCC 11539]